jgi:hypothetical protein
VAVESVERSEVAVESVERSGAAVGQGECPTAVAVATAGCWEEARQATTARRWFAERRSGGERGGGSAQVAASDRLAPLRPSAGHS